MELVELGPVQGLPRTAERPEEWRARDSRRFVRGHTVRRFDRGPPPLGRRIPFPSRTFRARPSSVAASSFFGTKRRIERASGGGFCLTVACVGVPANSLLAWGPLLGGLAGGGLSGGHGGERTPELAQGGGRVHEAPVRGQGLLPHLPLLRDHQRRRPSNTLCLFPKHAEARLRVRLEEPDAFLRVHDEVEPEELEAVGQREKASPVSAKPSKGLRR